MNTSLLFLILTIGIYLGAKKLYKQKSKIYLNPLLITPLVIVIVLLGFHIPYSDYNGGGKWLTAMLDPATIAFAVPLYKYFPVLKKHAAEILIGVFSGSLIGMGSGVLLSKLFHLDSVLISSMIPRSVTTPIAMDISKIVGGVPAMTAAFVILTGVLGTVIGPLIIRYLRIDNDIARGTLFGTGAHGAGTSVAFEYGSVTGTISSVSMILAALFSLCLAPLL